MGLIHIETLEHWNSQRLSDHTYEFSKADASGYGHKKLSGPPSKNLQIVTLDVISKAQCNENYPYQITDSQICTLTPGKDTCNVSDQPKHFHYYPLAIQFNPI